MSYVQTKVKTSRNRRRNITWFNPPFIQNVKINIGKIFLRLTKKHFPNHHRLHKISKLSTIKLSYSCMGNIWSFIKQFNRNILSSSPNSEERPCNCRNKDNCWQFFLNVHWLQRRYYQAKWNTRILWRIQWRVQVSVHQSHKFVSELRLWKQNWTLKTYKTVKT